MASKKLEDLDESAVKHRTVRIVCGRIRHSLHKLEADKNSLAALALRRLKAKEQESKSE